MAWPKEIVNQVWEKGSIIPKMDEKYWRKDECGAWIYRKHYANHNSPYGWEIEKISISGPSMVNNFRPLQWENYVDRDGQVICIVTHNGKENVIKN